MSKGHRLVSRAATAKIGALAAVVLLVLGVPTLAFAANTATFSSVSPKGGSFTKANQPTVSVIVYDKYGVKTGYSLYVDGVKVSAKVSRYSGYGYKKFKLYATVPAALADGSHTVKAAVKDLASKSSSYSWTFGVDTMAPVTAKSGTVAQFVAPGSSTVGGFLFLTASDAGSGVAQTYFSIDGAAPVAGSLAVYSFTAGPHTIAYWSVDKAGNVEGHHVVSTTVSNGHSLPTNALDSSCLAAGCHGGTSDVLAIHAKVAPNGCPCHSSNTLTNDCVACHSGSAAPANHATHKAIESSATPNSTTSCTNANFGCHGTKGLYALHGNDCSVCHNPGADSAIPAAKVNAVVAAGIAGTPANCESCHGSYSEVHVAGNAAHVKSGACFTSGCHGTDVTAMHMKDFSGRGADAVPGCAACHAAGKVPTTNCTSCHPDIVSPHDTSKAHATLVDNLNGSPAAACTACHGNDVNSVGSRVSAGGAVSVPADPKAAVQEHNGCSCHVYAEVKVGAKQTCVSCHDGAYGATHGWKVSSGPYSAGTWNVSGHNTTAYGTVGARTTFTDLGIKDTVNATPTVEMPLTVNNTFKAGVTDSTGAQMGWSSVITCEDCHTGLKGKEVAGPHGGSTVDNWGIDPAYSGSFESASLWGGTYSQKLADGTTYTVGPFASGIAQWANTSSDPEGLAGYQVVTPDMSTATSTALVKGPATVTDGNVICVKCHDLYDGTKTTGFKGWGNYAHEHHSADTGSFSMYFGKYEVGDGGVKVTSQTVSAESAAAAMAQVPGATKNKQIVKEALGREDAGACRNCHIAIPHGWKRPKLIVYSNMADPTPGYRASLGLPAQGDVAPYNIGPAVYEGEALNGTAVGSGQMNGLASSPVVFKEATHLLSGQVATQGSDPALLEIETYNYPSIYTTENPANGGTYVNWSSAQCNACGHHSSTSFAVPNAAQPSMSWNSRESNWTSTKPAYGAWK